MIPDLKAPWGPAGSKWLDDQEPAEAYRYRVISLPRFIGRYDIEITDLDRRIQTRLADDVGYQLIQQLDGVGPVLAAVLVAEIGDASRFPTRKRLCPWAGLRPRHRESDTMVIRGPIIKQTSWRPLCAGWLGSVGRE